MTVRSRGATLLEELQLVVGRLARRFIWTLSALLIAVGTLILFIFAPGFSATNYWLLTGTVLLETGAVTLIIELLSLQSLVSVKVPQVIFSHGYLQVASEKELTKLLDDSIRAKLGYSRLPESDLERGRSWLIRTLGSPMREDYRANIRLRREPAVERFDDGSSTGGREPNRSLWIDIRYEYRTERNLTSETTLINGDGVIHRLRDAIPDGTDFARRYRSGELRESADSRILAWVRNTLDPRVTLLDPSTRSPISANQSVQDLIVYEDVDGVLWMQFSVRSNHRLRPNEQVEVLYTQRWCVNSSDTHYWVAFGRTHNFQFGAENFQDFELQAIAAPSRWSQEGSLRVKGNLIIYTGMVYPDSAFAFAWSGKRIP